MPDSLLRDRNNAEILRLADPPAKVAVASLGRRAVDVTVALVLLALALPLLLLVALAVRLDGPGPVLQREYRIGHGGRRFQLLAFRSTEGPSRAPTRLGRWMRPVRIDQLPVLLNLLRGDMTLVGPAPAEGWDGAAEGPLPRPGVTGWARAD